MQLQIANGRADRVVPVHSKERAVDCIVGEEAQADALVEEHVRQHSAFDPVHNNNRAAIGAVCQRLRVGNERAAAARTVLFAFKHEDAVLNRIHGDSACKAR